MLAVIILRKKVSTHYIYLTLKSLEHVLEVALLIHTMLLLSKLEPQRQLAALWLWSVV
jgi:hypothetical protein